MIIKLDISDVSAGADRASEAFADMSADVFGFVEAGADILQSRDPYQNRTGNLRRDTQAIEIDGSPDFHYQLIMDQEYASFVRDMGLSDFDAVGELVGEKIEEYLTVNLPGKFA